MADEVNPYKATGVRTHAVSELTDKHKTSLSSIDDFLAGIDDVIGANEIHEPNAR